MARPRHSGGGLEDDPIDRNRVGGEMVSAPDTSAPVEDSILKSITGPGGGDILNPNLPDFHDAREAEKPRLRQPQSSLGAAAAPKPSVQMRAPASQVSQATPSRPTEPTPMAGSVSQATSTAGVMPFQPLGGEQGGDLVSAPGAAIPGARLRNAGGLLGASGGLRGGGLGVPFDPVADEASDPFDTLLKKLMGGSGGY